MSNATASASAVVVRPTLRGHISIARIDHWFKNVFVIPGIVAAIGTDPDHIAPGIWTKPRLMSDCGRHPVCVEL